MKTFSLVFLILLCINYSFGQTDPFIIAEISKTDSSCTLLPNFAKIDPLIENYEPDKKIIIAPLWYGEARNDISLIHLILGVVNTRDGGTPSIVLSFMDGSKMELTAKSTMEEGRSYYLLTKKQEAKLSTVEIFGILYINTYDSIAGKFVDRRYFIDLFELVNSGNYTLEPSY